MKTTQHFLNKIRNRHLELVGPLLQVEDGQGRAIWSAPTTGDKAIALKVVTTEGNVAYIEGKALFDKYHELSERQLDTLWEAEFAPWPLFLPTEEWQEASWAVLTKEKGKWSLIKD